MDNYREELSQVLKLKETGGFHYTHKAHALLEKAKAARHWKCLLKTSPTQWRTILRDTRYVLDQLDT
ncbi:hypothetical protein IQ260_06790 [Leptolyngbya cf. ectocarpi LEGE 11479]|uniref:Uncharacterized protein n=1 Tax=Leptolyngbya cf. ectocarpi LEGE 11479 TaxID=1828722 RepID=A0A928ZQL3_LEPEC|nr:hypothetical protein [Leptolyngbya ectocarpi]MBE9066355.1 hypothetical protein [Leptolyngbya cf. ectocarpi LEGE 11479]